MFLSLLLTVASHPDSMGLSKSRIVFLFNIVHYKNLSTFVKNVHKTRFFNFLHLAMTAKFRIVPYFLQSVSLPNMVLFLLVLLLKILCAAKFGEETQAIK